MNRLLVSLSLAATFALAAATYASPDGDWPRFRGPNGSGISEAAGLPNEINPKANLLWRIEMSEGLSSPVVSGGRLFLTSSEGDRRTLHCLSAKDGRTQWTKNVNKTHEELFAPPNGPATPTPVTDGKQVFALFPDAGLFAHSISGEEQWHIELGRFDSMRGMASSPVLVDQNVVVVADMLTDSYIAAYDAATGKQAWKVSRFNGMGGGYSTPSVYRPAGGAVQIIAPGPMEMVAYNAATGERAWWIRGITKDTASLPVVAGERVFVCEPPSQPLSMNSIIGIDQNKDGHIMLTEAKSPSTRRWLENIDKVWGNNDGEVTQEEFYAANRATQGGGGLTSVRLGGAGDVTASNVEWNYRWSTPQVPSVLAYRDVLYLAQGSGILVTLDPKDGKVLRRARMNGAGADYMASPVAGDGKLYLVSGDDGVATVIKAGAEWEVLSSHPLDDKCYATPAIAGGRIYIRTAKWLWCFGAADGGTER